MDILKDILSNEQVVGAFITAAAGIFSAAILFISRAIINFIKANEKNLAVNTIKKVLRTYIVDQQQKGGDGAFKKENVIKAILTNPLTKDAIIKYELEDEIEAFVEEVYQSTKEQLPKFFTQAQIDEFARNYAHVSCQHEFVLSTNNATTEPVIPSSDEDLIDN